VSFDETINPDCQIKTAVLHREISVTREESLVIQFRLQRETRQSCDSTRNNPGNFLISPEFPARRLIRRLAPAIHPRRGTRLTIAKERPRREKTMNVSREPSEQPTPSARRSPSERPCRLTCSRGDPPFLCALFLPPRPDDNLGNQYSSGRLFASTPLQAAAAIAAATSAL